MGKKIIVLALMACLLLIGFSTSVLAGSQDFTLVNETGLDIHNIYIAPSKSNNWESEVLGEDILRDGESVDITFSGRSETYWDIMVKDKQGNQYVWEKFNLKEINTITLYRDGSKLWAEYK